jgi:SAM-dependent methyltransferase
MTSDNQPRIRPHLQVLSSSSELDEARLKQKALGLCASPDAAKVWDNVLAVEDLRRISRNSPILDIGCRSGILLTWLSQLGFRSLWGVDVRLPLPPVRASLKRGQLATFLACLAYLVGHGGHLRRGRAERLPFPDSRFTAVACMSVLEHGVDQRRFLDEAHRVLAPNGSLIVSTDFWYLRRSRSSRLFGGVDMIFNPEDISAFLDMASSAGFHRPAGPESPFILPEPVIDSAGSRYSFLYMVLSKRS